MYSSEKQSLAQHPIASAHRAWPSTCRQWLANLVPPKKTRKNNHWSSPLCKDISPTYPHPTNGIQEPSVTTNTCGENAVDHDIEADEGGRTIAVEAASELDIDDRQNRFSLSVGNLVHQALAHIALGYRNGRVCDLDAVTAYLEQQLPKLDAYPDQWQQVKEVALLHIDRTLKNPAGQWLLEAHVHGQVEWPITIAVDGVAKRLVMDRIFFSRDSWWIVDYKTAEPDLNQAVSDFIAQEVSRYRGQLDQYSRALSALLSDQPERFESSASTKAPIKTALYFTALPRLETLPTLLD